MSLKLRGEFSFIHPQTKKLVTVPNAWMTAALESVLKMIMQAAVSDVTSGGNWYIGLMGPAGSVADTLLTIAGEPVGNGYSRQAVTRNSTGWPTIETVNTDGHARSAIATFSASGGNFNVAVSRLFLCNVSTGTSGILYSESAIFPAAISVLDGESLPVQYDVYLN